MNTTLPSSQLTQEGVYGNTAAYKGPPSADDIANGVVPLDTLPAQWWNWLWNSAGKDIDSWRAELVSIRAEILNVLRLVDNTAAFNGSTTQIASALSTLITRIATATTAGAVKSSADIKSVSVDSSEGTMVVNALTDYVGSATIETRLASLKASIDDVLTGAVVAGTISSGVITLASSVTAQTFKIALTIEGSMAVGEKTTVTGLQASGGTALTLEKNYVFVCREAIAAGATAVVPIEVQGYKSGSTVTYTLTTKGSNNVWQDYIEPVGEIATGDTNAVSGGAIWTALQNVGGGGAQVIDAGTVACNFESTTSDVYALQLVLSSITLDTTQPAIVRCDAQLTSAATLSNWAVPLPVAGFLAMPGSVGLTVEGDSNHSYTLFYLNTTATANTVICSCTFLIPANYTSDTLATLLEFQTYSKAEASLSAGTVYTPYVTKEPYRGPFVWNGENYRITSRPAITYTRGTSSITDFQFRSLGYPLGVYGTSLCAPVVIQAYHDSEYSGSAYMTSYSGSDPRHATAITVYWAGDPSTSVPSEVTMRTEDGADSILLLASIGLKHRGRATYVADSGKFRFVANSYGDTADSYAITDRYVSGEGWKVPIQEIYNALLSYITASSDDMENQVFAIPARGHIGLIFADDVLSLTGVALDGDYILIYAEGVTDASRHMRYDMYTQTTPTTLYFYKRTFSVPFNSGSSITLSEYSQASGGSLSYFFTTHVALLA